MNVIVARSRKEIVRCYPVMAQLRPHLKEPEFVRQVQRQMQTGSYSLAMLEDGGRVKALAGFRFLENLAWGRFMYVDDLVTDEAERSKGYGQKLFAWLIEQAKVDCDELHLDSGVQRFGAHRFYLASGMDITAHHFAMKLK